MTTLDRGGAAQTGHSHTASQAELRLQPTHALSTVIPSPDTGLGGWAGDRRRWQSRREREGEELDSLYYVMKLQPELWRFLQGSSCPGKRQDCGCLLLNQHSALVPTQE